MNPLIFIHRVNLRRSCFGIFAIVEMQIIVTFKLDSALVLAASEARVSPISLCQCICMCKKEKTNLCCFQVRGLCFSSKVIKYSLRFHMRRILSSSFLLISCGFFIVCLPSSPPYLWPTIREKHFSVVLCSHSVILCNRWK